MNFYCSRTARLAPALLQVTQKFVRFLAECPSGILLGAGLEHRLRLVLLVETDQAASCTTITLRPVLALLGLGNLGVVVYCVGALIFPLLRLSAVNQRHATLWLD